MMPSAGSTSPKPVNHFDKEEPTAIICCFSCREALWEQRVRQVQGKVVSHRTLPVGKNSCSFSEKDHDCPLCNRPYFKSQGKEKKFLFRSPITGKDFVV
jgi:hypothetical protein